MKGSDGINTLNNGNLKDIPSCLGMTDCRTCVKFTLFPPDVTCQHFLSTFLTHVKILTKFVKSKTSVPEVKQTNPRWDRRPLRSRPSEVFHCYQRGDHVLLIYVHSRSEAGAGRSMPLLCEDKCYTYHTLCTWIVSPPN